MDGHDDWAPGSNHYGQMHAERERAEKAEALLEKASTEDSRVKEIQTLMGANEELRRQLRDAREESRGRSILITDKNKQINALDDSVRRLEANLKMLRGVTFSDRCYHALKSRAETAEKQLSRSQQEMTEVRSRNMLLNEDNAALKRELNQATELHETELGRALRELEECYDKNQ